MHTIKPTYTGSQRRFYWSTYQLNVPEWCRNCAVFAQQSYSLQCKWSWKLQAGTRTTEEHTFFLYYSTLDRLASQSALSQSGQSSTLIILSPVTSPMSHTLHPLSAGLLFPTLIPWLIPRFLPCFLCSNPNLCLLLTCSLSGWTTFLWIVSPFHLSKGSKYAFKDFKTPILLNLRQVFVR